MQNPTLPKGVHKNLEEAIKEAQPGDRILIRGTGLVELDPVELKRADTRLDILPEEGSRPILTPATKAGSLKKDAALFKLYGGSVIFEGLHFKLKTDRVPSVICMPGGGECTLRNCVITLEEGDDLSAVTFHDPKAEMMMPGSAVEKLLPRFTMENVFVRGKGNLCMVRSSRPIEMELKNCIAALEGSLLVVDPAVVDPSNMGIASIRLDQVTAVTTGPLLVERATDKPMETKGLGLVQAQVQATRCLFVPAADPPAPLISLERVDNMEQARDVFMWKDCKQNVYGYPRSEQELLAVVPDKPAGTMPTPERMDRDRWLTKWRESDYIFGEVRFQVEATRPAAARPEDYAVKPPVGHPAGTGEMTHYGADVDVLRKRFYQE